MATSTSQVAQPDVPTQHEAEPASHEQCTSHPTADPDEEWAQFPYIYQVFKDLRAAKHLYTSTWLSFGSITLEKLDTDLKRDAWTLPRIDTHPHPYMPWAIPNICTFVGDHVGLPTSGRIVQYQDKDISSWAPELVPRRLANMQRTDAIPIEERLWCLAMLASAFDVIRSHITSLPYANGNERLDADAGEMDRMGRSRPLCEGGFHPDPNEASSGVANFGDETAFSIVAPHPASVTPRSLSALRRYREARTPHPSTWGYEVLSTPVWDKTYAKAVQEGAETQRVLVLSCIAACERTLRRIARARKWLLARVADMESNGGQPHNASNDGLAEALALPELSLADVSTPLQHTPARHALDDAQRDPIRDEDLLSTVNSRNHPQAVANRVDYTPSFALVGGTVEREVLLGKASDETSEAVGEIGDAAHEPSGSTSGSSAGSGASTPRPGTPTAAAAQTECEAPS